MAYRIVLTLGESARKAIQKSYPLKHAIKLLNEVVLWNQDTTDPNRWCKLINALHSKFGDTFDIRVGVHFIDGRAQAFGCFVPGVYGTEEPMPILPASISETVLPSYIKAVLVEDGMKHFPKNRIPQVEVQGTLELQMDESQQLGERECLETKTRVA